MCARENIKCATPSEDLFSLDTARTPEATVSTRWKWRAYWLTRFHGYKEVWVAQHVDSGWFGRLTYRTTWLLEPPWGDCEEGRPKRAHRS